MQNFLDFLLTFASFFPTQVKREEVERRVKEDEEVYSSKFSEDAQVICKQVSVQFVLSFRAQ